MVAPAVVTATDPEHVPIDTVSNAPTKPDSTSLLLPD
jgi:hypothetical protein